MIVEETPLPRHSARRVRVARTKQGRRASREARFIVLTGLRVGKNTGHPALETSGILRRQHPDHADSNPRRVVRAMGISRVAIVVDVRGENFLAEFAEDVSAASGT